MRFQDEILKGTRDESMFAWNGSNNSLAVHDLQGPNRGLLALRPSQFSKRTKGRHFSNALPSVSPPGLGWDVTRGGTKIQLHLVEYDPNHHPSITSSLKRHYSTFFVSPLLCGSHHDEQDKTEIVFIILAGRQGLVEHGIFDRIERFFTAECDWKEFEAKYTLKSVLIEHSWSGPVSTEAFQMADSIHKHKEHLFLPG